MSSEEKPLHLYREKDGCYVMRHRGLYLYVRDAGVVFRWFCTATGRLTKRYVDKECNKCWAHNLEEARLIFTLRDLPCD